MYIHGEFANQVGQVVSVEIVTNGSRTEELEIGGGDVYFTDDPVEISDEANDTLDVLLCRSATVRLLCRNFVPDFFCASCRDATVAVTVDDVCVFAGFIEPQTYSQGYNELYDEVELNCIDALSALQYSKYKDVGSSSVDYSDVKSSAGQLTFLDLVTSILQPVVSCFSSAVPHIYFDGSKRLTQGDTSYYSVWNGISVNELLFLGDEEDDVWQQDAVLEEVLRYLDLHIVQDGKDFYVFSWSAVKQGGSRQWVDLLGNNTDIKTTTGQTVEISTANVADTDTKISIGEVYNQLLLTDSIESMDTVIESPLADDSLTSPFTGKQLYLTEFVGTDREATEKMIKGQATTNENCKETDWYMQMMMPANWKLYYDGVNTIDKLLKVNAFGQYYDQWLMAEYLRKHSCVPCIFSMGSVSRKASATDNSPVANISMSNYLYISINGNEDDGDTTATPTDDTIKSHSPMLEYTGNTSGGVFSPSDENTTNYLVFSGKMLIQSVVYESSSKRATRTNSYQDIRSNGLAEGGTGLLPSFDPASTLLSNILNNNKVKSTEFTDKGRFYSRRFYSYMFPSGSLEHSSSYITGVQPWTSDKGGQGYKYNYSQKRDGTDKMKKLPILECELIIGDKRLVETDMDEYGNSTFKWYTVGQEPQVIDGDGETYRLTTFSLGVNPAIGDYIIGTEFDIQNTVDYKMNLDVEGTAIPIKMEDKVSGSVIFRILGPVNSIWNDITKRHRSFWRHAKYTENARSVLAHTENIIIKDFECKVVSDNGLLTSGGDNDIVYMSDTDEAYVNKKDDLEFKICSALTTEECNSLGVANTVALSTALDVSTGVGLLAISDSVQGVEGKPEQLYVDAYYREYHKPRIQMEQNLLDGDGSASLFNHYRHPALGKDFFVLGFGRNLMEGTVQLNLKEIDND